jgi:DNA topoisomerase I
MADARKQRISVTIEGGGATFTASGTSILFEGFLRAYVEGQRRPAKPELAEQETILPNVKENDPLDAESTRPQGPHHPAAGAVHRSLADADAGRKRDRPAEHLRVDHRNDPRRRNYVYKKGTPWCPAGVAFSVTRLMETHFGTAGRLRVHGPMEDFLDSISRAKASTDDEYLKKFLLRRPRR